MGEHDSVQRILPFLPPPNLPCSNETLLVCLFISPFFCTVLVFVVVVVDPKKKRGGRTASTSTLTSIASPAAANKRVAWGGNALAMKMTESRVVLSLVSKLCGDSSAKLWVKKRRTMQIPEA